MRFGKSTFGQTTLPYQGLYIDSIKDFSSGFQNTLGPTYLGQSKNIAMGINGVVDVSKIDTSSLPNNIYSATGLTTNIATSGTPFPNNRSYISALNIGCELQDTPAANSMDGVQNASAITGGVFTYNSRLMQRMIGIDYFVYYGADSGGVGGANGQPYTGILGSSFGVGVSGGSHSNLVGIEGYFQIYSNATIAKVYGIRSDSAVYSQANITDAYGAYVQIENQSGQPTIAQNVYGIYITDVSDIGATRNYSICSNGGPSYFRDDIRAGAYKLNNVQPAPATSTATGSRGQIVFASDAIYFCIDTNRWKRATLTDF